MGSLLTGIRGVQLSRTVNGRSFGVMHASEAQGSTCKMMMRTQQNCTHVGAPYDRARDAYNKITAAGHINDHRASECRYCIVNAISPLRASPALPAGCSLKKQRV